MTPATLLRAAEIIERDAERIANAYWHPGDGLWDENGRARREHDENLAIAAELRKGAA